jgi:hypothetical protein
MNEIKVWPDPVDVTLTYVPKTPEPRTFWFVVCWSESGASYRAGPYDNYDEAEQAARMSMTREGQVITLMETVPQIPLR